MDSSPIELITRLCKALDDDRICYCHWKSNVNIALSLSGKNDLDLLLSRGDLQRFQKRLFELGFKECYVDPINKIPGVQDFIGYDPNADTFVHVHAHYQLILGHDLSKNYRLAIERPYLSSTKQDSLLKIPAPEFELIIFLIRMIIKHSTWFAFIFGESKLSKSELAELDYLLNNTDNSKVNNFLEMYLPYIDSKLFHECLRSLQTNVHSLKRIHLGARFLSKLNSSTRNSYLLDFFSKIFRRGITIFRRRILKHNLGFRLANGGAMIAIVGGDGAGKTTAVDTLYQWLVQEFDVKEIHMGKPPWSLTTLIIRAVLRIGRTLGLYPFMRAPIHYEKAESERLFPGYPWLIREVLTARDRYYTYRKARRYATNGGLILSDRFPLAGIRRMDGPLGEQFLGNQPITWFLRKLIEIEKNYYRQILLPEIIIVLRTDPEIAVQRKTEEDPVSVRARSKEIWEFDWSAAPAIVIDANQPINQVVTNLKSAIWSAL